MELTEDQGIENYGKQYLICTQKTLLSYEYEFTSVSCGDNVMKRKHELSRNNEKK